ncbi:type IV secretory system conjugative DNA transfer family protein [Klebsiella quasipneumoniae]|uniref:type IV secretory system conjugative DNA transfer family protein n=1 Tax=Klebsiella quasipneumoniae TaxID=1463165 RepID=UPI003A837B96
MKLKLIVLLTLPLLAANVARADDSDVKGLDYYMDPPSQSDDEADVTGSMLNDAAHTIGFRGGKAERAKEIRAALENQRSNLDYMYSFQPLISSEGYLPPVIAEAKDVAHITNEQIRTANRAYDIVVPARFVSNPPTWKSYLLTGLMAQRIELPEPAAMPKDGKQRDIWKKAVALGWSDGRQKADEIFTANFNRLTRDYTGMLRYSTLLQQGMIKAPVITQQQQTVTGDKNRLMLGDKTKRMKKQAEFDINKRSWKPTIR